MSNRTKSVAITGGASGLGKAMAFRFARAGWHVAIADIHDQRGQETLKELHSLTNDCFYSTVDVRKAEDILAWRDEILGRWSTLDVVINNAGVASHGGIAETSLEDWQWIMDINLMGVVRGCKFFTQSFKQQGFGHIVNVASMAGLLHSAEMNSYNAGKAAVVALSETMRHELESQGINVSVVCPGFFKTNLAESTRSPNARAKQYVNKLLATSNITADDIAEMVFIAVKKKHYLVLPHPAYRRTWYLKRYTPFLYHKIMSTIAKKRASMQKKHMTKESNGVIT